MFRWWSSTKNEESATPIEVLGTITNTTIGVATTIIILHYVVHRYFQTPLLAQSMTQTESSSNEFLKGLYSSHFCHLNSIPDTP